MQDVIDRAERLRIRAYAKARSHFLTAKYCQRMHMIFGIPPVITSTVVGTTIFATLSSEPDVRLRIAAGLFSIAAAVLAALQTFFRYSESAEKHLMAGASYSASLRTLEIYLLKQAQASSAERDTAIEELKTIVEEINRLDKGSPDVPDRFYDRARQEQKEDEEGL